ncbi:asparagine synthase (glutamine-hydrolyzing) [Gammaproteobacteria bacterium]|nr:asparagine synthase (glutamine-hydrolyzing) [Gammaproteobacteria bacterium]
MCGIVGFVDYSNKTKKQTIRDMTNSMTHRGPDGADTWSNSNNNNTISLGHRRLSILDLSQNGTQPMTFDGLTIVFNGEIYNFKDIKKELASNGYKFLSNSDTEVLLKAFHCWGPDSVNKFIGMFAYVIYSEKNNKFYLFRDRVGVKPLYYSCEKDYFVFSSELKALTHLPSFKKIISSDGMMDYFSKGYISGPYSIYKNVYKLNPGSYAIYDIKSKEFKEKSYWDIVDFYGAPKFSHSYEEAVQNVEELLSKSLDHRMISDVPVGTFLSGGYDSSLVTALLVNNGHQKLKTFTIGFENKSFDESSHAKKIAEFLGTDHHELFCTADMMKEKVLNYSEMFDEPFSDTSAIPVLILSELSKNHITVSLSADGGDELFAGYDKYIIADKLFKKYSNSAPFKFFKYINPNLLKYVNFPINNRNTKSNILQRMGYANAKNPLDVMKVMGSYLTEYEEKELFAGISAREKSIYNQKEEYPCHNSYLQQMMSFDFQTYLRDEVMVKVDRATMFASLEGREPLLDHKLIEYVTRLPHEFHSKNYSQKSILKDIAHKYIPEDLLNRPKHGFSVPIGDWLRTDFKDLVMDTITDEAIQRTGMFNKKTINKNINDYYSGNKIGHKYIWTLFIYFQWQDRWL